MKRPLAAAALILGGILAVVGNREGEEWEAGILREEEVCLTGTVCQIEEKEENSFRVLIRKIEGAQSTKEGILCKLKSGVRPKMGSRIRIKGTFRTFMPASNPGQFSVKKYYQSLHVAGYLQNADLLAASPEYDRIGESLWKARQAGVCKFYQVLPEKEASVMAAMLLGEKAGLEEETKLLYRQGGIIHILSISGLHISLIGAGLYKALKRLGCPQPVSTAVSGTVLVFYGILTGMGVSAQRAIGMFLIYQTAQIVGRTYDMLTALSVMAAVILAGNPAFVQNSGFVLSFSSVAGFGLLAPLFQKRLRQFTEKDMVSRKRKVCAFCMKAAIPGISVTLMTLPLQLVYFQEAPVYGLILNLLVVPVTGILAACGMAVLILPPFPVFSLPVCLFTGYFDFLCELSGRLPGNLFRPGYPGAAGCIGYYGFLTLAAFFLTESSRKKRKTKEDPKRFLCPCLSGICLTAAFAVLIGTGKAGEGITFLDVGQGDAVFVRTDNGRNYLFDCGSSSREKVGEEILLPFLKYQGVSELDGIFISHPDADHCNGILELLSAAGQEKIKIDHLFLPAMEPERRKEEYGEIFKVLEENGLAKEIRIGYLQAGEWWQEGKFRFVCLNPPKQIPDWGSNEYSLCFCIRRRDFTVLLTADTEKRGEEALITQLKEQEISHVNVLKVAHHGSANATTEAFLKECDADFAVISCGEKNRYGHPSSKLLERLNTAKTRYAVTWQQGAVTIRFRGKTPKIRFWGKE